MHLEDAIGHGQNGNVALQQVHVPDAQHKRERQLGDTKVKNQLKQKQTRHRVSYCIEEALKEPFGRVQQRCDVAFDLQTDNRCRQLSTMFI